MKKDDVIRKIKACLARASKTDSENERATALRHAQAMMSSNGLTEEDLHLSEVKEADARGCKAKTLARWDSFLIDIVNDTFATTALLLIETAGWAGYQATVKFMGFGVGPELAAYAYQALRRQLVRDRTAYLKKNKRLKASTKTRRADFFAEAWVYAAAQHVVKLRPTAQQKALIDLKIQRDMGNLPTAVERSHDRQPGDAGAILDGIKLGEAVRLHHGVAGSMVEYPRLSAGVSECGRLTPCGSPHCQCQRGAK